MGWSFPWASSNDSDCNFEIDVSLTEEQQCSGSEYNFSEEPPASTRATDVSRARQARVATAGLKADGTRYVTLALKSSRMSSAKTVSAMYALACHNLVL